MRKFLRFYSYLFIRKHVFVGYSKYVDIVAGYFGFNMNINVKTYVLNNNSVSAMFIARFLAIGLFCRNDYRDMIIPIRRSLGRLMFNKR